MGIPLQILIKFLAILVIFVFFICLRVLVADDYPAHLEVLDVKSINTGDLLGVGYSSAFGSFTTFWSESVWSHVGIAWRSPETQELYVLESANYHEPWTGVFRIPFHIWCNLNKRSLIGVTRLRSPDGQKVDSDRLLRTFNEYSSIPLDSFSLDWARFLVNRPYTGQMMKAYTCYELVVSVLQKMDIMKKELACSSFFPRHLAKAEIPLESGYSYSAPIELNCSSYIRALKAR